MDSFATTLDKAVKSAAGTSFNSGEEAAAFVLAAVISQLYSQANDDLIRDLEQRTVQRSAEDCRQQASLNAKAFVQRHNRMIGIVHHQMRSAATAA